SLGYLPYLAFELVFSLVVWTSVEKTIDLIISFTAIEIISPYELSIASYLRYLLIMMISILMRLIQFYCNIRQPEDEVLVKLDQLLRTLSQAPFRTISAGVHYA
ncbi:hypothetical protein PENTCL1PPCAC_10055, partial [Pristionchus entomophagus]